MLNGYGLEYIRAHRIEDIQVNAPLYKARYRHIKNMVSIYIDFSVMDL